MKKTAGFTLIEVLIATMVLTIALVSAIGLFAYLLALPEGGRDSVIALHEAETKMEEICTNHYLTIRDGDTSAGLPAYTNTGALLRTPFALAGLTGQGIVYGEELPGAADGLMRIKVVVCYRQKNRIIGEDDGAGAGTALDGILNGAEDANGNGEIDSPCQLETVVVMR